MRISVLADNLPGTHTSAEHGLSYLIEFEEQRILFDTGQSNSFWRRRIRFCNGWQRTCNDFAPEIIRRDWLWSLSV